MESLTAKILEQESYRDYEIPAWMDFPEEEISEDDDEEEELSEDDEEEELSEDDDEEEELSEEEVGSDDDIDEEEDGKRYSKGDSDDDNDEVGKRYRKAASDERKRRRKWCIAWLLARKEILNKIEENREEGEMSDELAERRREEIRRAWGEVSADERAGWKASEKDRLEDISFAMIMKNIEELEQAFGIGTTDVDRERRDQLLDMELLENDNKEYLEFRNMWIAIHSGRGAVTAAFHAITTILPMQYTDRPAPRYVHNYGPPDALEIFSVKVVGRGGDGGILQWPLHVFGLVAVRDSIDHRRNVIFNRARDDCQTLTKEDPYLVLTGPKRAVVMNEESIPVTIEAELKVKSTDDKSEDKHLIFSAVALPSKFGSSGSIDLMGKYMNLKIALERIMTCVEATIFTRVIHGTWPAGFNGQLAARASSTSDSREIVLADFGGDDDVPVDENGDVDQSRRVVCVEAFGELMVSCRAWRGGDETMHQDEVAFKAEKKGRSFGTLRIACCVLEVLVAWSRIEPVCGELVSTSEYVFDK